MKYNTKYANTLCSLVFASSVGMSTSSMAQRPESVLINPIGVEIDCAVPTFAVGFFNGVFNSRAQAWNNVYNIRPIVGEFDPNSFPILFDIFYNNTEGARDIGEFLLQKNEEFDPEVLKRFGEIFWYVRESPEAANEFASDVRQVDPNLADRLANFLDDTYAQLVFSAGSAVADIFTDLPTQEYQLHRDQIDTYHDLGINPLLVAHSQGNLFATNLYDYAVETKEHYSESEIKLVHVAPPLREESLRGPHVLSNADTVISGAVQLLGAGAVPIDTITTVEFFQENDPLGHSFRDIYLEPPVRQQTVFLILDQWLSLSETSDPVAFEVKISWEPGSPDIDLFVQEPDSSGSFITNTRLLDIHGNQIPAFSTNIGTSGFISPNIASGPETYSVYCDPNTIEGVTRIFDQQHRHLIPGGSTNSLGDRPLGPFKLEVVVGEEVVYQDDDTALLNVSNRTIDTVVRKDARAPNQDIYELFMFRHPPRPRCFEFIDLICVDTRSF